jgi:uncharacterized membrane protein YesL
MVVALLGLAVVAWLLPPDDRWLFGFPLNQFVGLALAALAALAWAAPWIRADPVTAFLAAVVAVIVLVLTMVTVMPIFLIGAAAAVLRWAYRQRRQAGRGGA